MKNKTIVLAGLVGLLLSARGAMATSFAQVYNEDFATGLGIGSSEWQSADFVWNNTLGNGGPGSMSYVYNPTTPHDANFAYAQAFQNSLNTPLLGLSIPVSGYTLQASLDWYKSYTSNASYPYLSMRVTFADNSDPQYIVVQGVDSDSPGVWHTYTTTQTFSHPMEFVQFHHLTAVVPNNSDNLLVAVDNITISEAVPEPNVAMLLVIGGGMLFGWRRARS